LPEAIVILAFQFDTHPLIITVQIIFIWFLPRTYLLLNAPGKALAINTKKASDTIPTPTITPMYFMGYIQ
jgi:hypothetical protein